MPDMTLEAHGAHYIAPDIHGQNFFAIDRQFQDLMSLYMEPGLRAQMTPHFDRRSKRRLPGSAAGCCSRSSSSSCC